MSSRFLQIHTLTSYPAALLNRDDAGFAKQIPFGAAVRTRISSQCLKRHWRTFDGVGALASLGLGMSVRSRRIFEDIVLPRLLNPTSGDSAAPVEESKARAVIDVLMKETLGESAKAKAASQEEGGVAPAEAGKEKKSKSKAKSDSLQTGQVVVLGEKEIGYLVALAHRMAGETAEGALTKDEKQNLKTMVLGAGLDAALFGRMVTSDILARCDAAVHVAHAFTVHAAQTEADYFSAVDDLTQGEGELGAGHINSVDLTSGLYYGYVAVDVPLLVSNLTGCNLRKNKDAWKTADADGLAGKVIESLVHTVATVSPGAKLGSTAPHSYACLMLVEAADAQPCTLANAFVRPTPTGGDLVANAYADVAREVSGLDANYPRAVKRAHLASREKDRHDRLVWIEKVGEKDGGGVEKTRVPVALGEQMNLDDLARWTAARIKD